MVWWSDFAESGVENSDKNCRAVVNLWGFIEKNTFLL